MEAAFARGVALIDRHWRWLVVLAWLGLCAYLLANRWGSIQGFLLNDTDDNMRIAQVRAWLNDGQGWYDLRQYKLNAPDGANIHWSRLVDLPLSGLILVGRLFLTGPQAEQFAVALAPMIPLLLLMVGLTLITRRLIHPAAWPIAIACLFFAGNGLGQFAPTRIDHHGWQLAFLAIGLSGIADPKRARGGLTLGIASALSLSIGLEMLIYLAIAGAAMVMFWIVEPDERRRLATYGASLAGGTAIGFVVFASIDNRLPVCDALSPVWLGDALVGGALLLGLAWWSPVNWKARLAGAAVAGILVAVFHATMYPQCLSRLEGVSDETYRLWLSHVSEARSITTKDWRYILNMIALPASALVGWPLLVWAARKDPQRLRQVIAVALPGITATALLLWQVRTVPTAELMGIPGAVALIVLAVPPLSRSRFMLVRVFGVVLLVLAALGALIPLVIDKGFPEKPANAQEKKRSKASRHCPKLWAMAPLQKLPPSTIFTFSDLSPRMIVITHHRGVIGPYHRNGEAIVDSMLFFRKDAANARRLADKYRADYVMTCPGMGQATVFAAEAPKGFYVQLEKGKVPTWLQPVPLPKNSPLKLWKVVR